MAEGEQETYSIKVTYTSGRVENFTMLSATEPSPPDAGRWWRIGGGISINMDNVESVEVKTVP